MAGKIARKFRLALILNTPPRQEIDRSANSQANQGHQQGRTDEIGHRDHENSSYHRAQGLLLLAVDEIPKPNRTPQQRSEKETGAKHLRERMPPKPESVMPKRFLPGIRVGWGSGVWGANEG